MIETLHFRASMGVAIAALLLATGCATLGPPYRPVEEIPEGKGAVYVYRPSQFVGGGVAYTVHAGTTPIAKLHSGSYMVYFADPGELEIWGKTESRSSVTLTVKAGEVYYVKGTVGVGLLVGRPRLIVVDAATGEMEIRQTKRSP
jgi:hypothetical protein